MAAGLLRDAVPPLDERAHEAAVAAFLAKAPKRARERAERRHRVLTDKSQRQILRHESSWGVDVIDELVIATDAAQVTFLTPAGGKAGGLHRTPGAMTGARHVFTSEIDESGQPT